MLISKITDSLIRINPNANMNMNLNSSYNNSLNNSIQKNENNMILFGTGIQSSYLMQDNSLENAKVDMNEGVINNLNGQELLIIPETPEFDSESSSENSKSSNESNTISVKEPKKIVELSISENMNFSYSTTYDNLDSISEGNYSKDVNLQKSVMKLIGVYLKEKIKSKNNENSQNHINNKEKEKEKVKEKEKDIEKINSIKNKKEKEKEKEKEKNNLIQTKEEKKEEDDVWAFLNDDEKNDDHVELNFKLDSSSSSKSSSQEKERHYSKTPKNRFKRNTDFASAAAKTKSRFKKNNSNVYEEPFEISSPKNRKRNTISKKKPKNLKKCTTIIHTKKKKKQILKSQFKSNKGIELDENTQQKNSDSNTILSSLDLSINDNLEEQGTYIKNYYKTFQKKEKNEDEAKSNSKNEAE